MKPRTTNRRVLSTRRKRGITDLVEFTSLAGAVLGTVTILELWGMPKDYRETALAPFYMGIGSELSDVLAKTQYEAQ